MSKSVVSNTETDNLFEMYGGRVMCLNNYHRICPQCDAMMIEVCFFDERPEALWLCPVCSCQFYSLIRFEGGLNEE